MTKLPPGQTLLEGGFPLIFIQTKSGLWTFQSLLQFGVVWCGGGVVVWCGGGHYKCCVGLGAGQPGGGANVLWDDG